MREDRYSQYKRKPERRTANDMLDDADDFADFLQRPAPRKAPPQPTYDDDGTFYGIPRLALFIILGNMSLWGIGLVTYWVGRLPALYIIMGIVALIIGGALWLAIAYIQWRFFWWLLALGASLSTLALGYFLVLLLTGAATLNSIHIPPYF